MAIALLSDEVSDLTLGKPALPCILAASPVRHALLALKLHRDFPEISVWDCPPPSLSGLGPHLPPSSLRGGGGGGDAPFKGLQSPAKAPASPAPLKDLEALQAAVLATTPAALGALGALPGGADHSFCCGRSGGDGHSAHKAECRCIGKVCMQKIICYLASDRSLADVAAALEAPVSVLLQDEVSPTVKKIEPYDSVIDALNLIVGGAQNLVVPIVSRSKKYGPSFKVIANQKRVLASTASFNTLVLTKHNGQDHCWLTQEDVLRFLLGHISVFSPMPMMSIEALGLVNTDVLMVGVDEEASGAIEMIKTACLGASAVAVVEKIHDDLDGAVRLVGDISCSTLEKCSESAALALATLPVGEFLLYTQGATDSFTDMICAKLHRKLGLRQQPLSKTLSVSSVLQSFEMLDESSDDESGADSPTGPHDLSRRWFSGGVQVNGGLAQSPKARSGPIFCRPKSSLIAVILQALAHRQHYIWVTNEDDSLVGIVTFLDILTVMFNHLRLSN